MEIIKIEDVRGKKANGTWPVVPVRQIPLGEPAELMAGDTSKTAIALLKYYLGLNQDMQGRLAEAKGNEWTKFVPLVFETMHGFEYPLYIVSSSVQVVYQEVVVFVGRAIADALYECQQLGAGDEALALLPKPDKPVNKDEDKDAKVETTQAF